MSENIAFFVNVVFLKYTSPISIKVRMQKAYAQTKESAIQKVISDFMSEKANIGFALAHTPVAFTEEEMEECALS